MDNVQTKLWHSTSSTPFKHLINTNIQQTNDQLILNLLASKAILILFESDSQLCMKHDTFQNLVNDLIAALFSLCNRDMCVLTIIITFLTTRNWNHNERFMCAISTKPVIAAIHTTHRAFTCFISLYGKRK